MLPVHVEQPAAEQVLPLQLQAGPLRLSVSLLQRAGVHDYAVNLSSLWFWPSLPADLRESSSAWSAPMGSNSPDRYRAGAENILFWSYAAGGASAARCGGADDVAEVGAVHHLGRQQLLDGPRRMGSRWSRIMARTNVYCSSSTRRTSASTCRAVSSE